MGADLGFSPAGLGLAVSVYFGVSALASVPSGAPGRAVRTGRGRPLRHPAGRRRSMLAVAAFARSYPVLVGLLALSAAANALGQLASNAALAQHVPARRQGLSFGVKQAAIPVSTLLAGVAVPTIALTAGWRWAFVAAAVAALATLAARTPAVARPGTAGRRRQRGRAGHGGAGGDRRGGDAGRRARPTRWAPSWWTPPAARGLSPGLAGLTLTLGSAVCVAARVGAGWLADRRETGHVALIAAMLLVGAVGLGLLALTGPVPLVVGVVLGFGLGWAWPGLMNFAVVRLHPQAPAAATSITQTGVYAGGCLGPLSLGPLAAHLGYPTMWTTAAVAMLLAAALMLVGSRLLTRAAAAAGRGVDQLVRSAMKSQSDSSALRAGPSGSGASCARAPSA